MSFKSLVFSALFFLCLQSVFSQELSVFSGVFSESFYQDDQRLTRKEFKELLRKEEASWQHWKRAEVYELVGLSTTVISGFLIGAAINRDDNTGLIIGGAASLAAGFVFVEIAQKNKRSAVLNYNQSLERKSAVRIALARRGLGLAVSF